MCFLTIMSPKVVCNELGQVQADRSFVCDAINPGVRLAQVAPLGYESVQTTFVPKTHPDAGFFFLGGGEI